MNSRRISLVGEMTQASGLSSRLCIQTPKGHSLDQIGLMGAYIQPLNNLSYKSNHRPGREVSTRSSSYYFYEQNKVSQYKSSEISAGPATVPMKKKSPIGLRLVPLRPPPRRSVDH